MYTVNFTKTKSYDIKIMKLAHIESNPFSILSRNSINQKQKSILQMPIYVETSQYFCLEREKCFTKEGVVEMTQL